MIRGGGTCSFCCDHNTLVELILYRQSLFKLSFHNSVMGMAMWTTIQDWHWSLYFSTASQMIQTWAAIWWLFFILIRIKDKPTKTCVIFYEVLLNMCFIFLQNCPIYMLYGHEKTSINISRLTILCIMTIKQTKYPDYSV